VKVIENVMFNLWFYLVSLVRYSMSKKYRDLEIPVIQSRIVSEIFNVEKYRDLEILVKGQSRSLKVLPFGRLSMVYY